MRAFISSINYCPVKSLSFQTVEKCEILKDVGISGDRIFAFTKDLDFNEAKLFEKSPEQRKGKWNKILTLKNSPFLNKYKFLFKENKLTLVRQNKNILTINVDKESETELLSNKITDLENSLKKPLFLIKNKKYPFFDTSISSKVNFLNSVSLINLKTINDFKEKIEKEIEPSRFRGNFYIDGIDAWEEQKWIGKIIKINGVSFKVEKNIPRCVAINLKPNSDDNNLNLLQHLRKTYNHFNMGIYLKALEAGKINTGDEISLE